MKHWDGRDRTDAAELPLSPAERARLRALFELPAHRSQARPHIGSWIGLTLAVGLLVGLALLLAPGDPIASDLMR
jgi:hypothetical protein